MPFNTQKKGLFLREVVATFQVTKTGRSRSVFF
jgi:hypothetical protein